MHFLSFRLLSLAVLSLLALNTVSHAAVTGQWDFTQRDLSATIGQSMDFLDGPNGETAEGTEFGTASSFGLPLIGSTPADPIQITAISADANGVMIEWDGGAAPYTVEYKAVLSAEGWSEVSATNKNSFTASADQRTGFFRISGQAGGAGADDPMVMKFPKISEENFDGGFIVPTGAFANGGGIYLNEYTVIMDVLFPESSSNLTRSLLQTDLSGNADFLVSDSNGVGARAFLGRIQPDTWHRIAFAVDQVNDSAGLFVDGIKVGDDSLDGGLDGRWALDQFFYLFNDDNGETETGYLSSLQVRDERVSDGLIATLGPPTPGGILAGDPPNPFIASVFPSPATARFPGRSTVGTNPEIQVVIQNGESAVVRNSIAMTFGQVDSEGNVESNAVEPSVSSSGETTTVSFTPTDSLTALSVYQVTVTFEDNADPANQLGTTFRFGVGPFEALPTEILGATGSGTNPGFKVRSAQAPEESILPLRLERALKQLNGTLTDPTDSERRLADQAIRGSNNDGSHAVTDVIDFSKDGIPGGNFFFDQLFPGIPGTAGHADQFSTEVVTYLQLEKGFHTFGTQVWIERTDVAGGDDDGLTVFAGTHPKDVFSEVVHTFERSADAPAFVSTTDDNLFSFVAPETGLYPFRLVYYQKSRGASLEWYSIDQQTGEKILINDSGAGRSIAAFQTSSDPNHQRSYVAEVNPTPGAQGVSAADPIEILIDDDGASIIPTSIRLTHNGSAVTQQSQVEKNGSRTTITYQPNRTRPDENNLLELIYRDNQGNIERRSWAFTSRIEAGGSGTTATGLWNFKGGLAADIGQDLEFFGGDTSPAAQNTEFSNTADLGIDGIDGKPADVMVVPYIRSNELGYIMRHGISPNGGGTKVNQYTLIYDVYIDTRGDSAASMIQIDSLNNTNDGDYFWQRNNFGQGGGGYNGKGTFTPGAWHRIALAVDLAANPPIVVKYADGIKQDEWRQQSLDQNRRALQEYAILFGDNGDEHRKWYVNSIQIRDGKLSDAQLAWLGGPSAEGIPADIPEINVGGQWDFNEGLVATVGEDLEFFGGAESPAAQNTEFGLASDFGIEGIDGEPTQVMVTPYIRSNELGYIMRHGLEPNGGGTKVNQYTLIYDVYLDTRGDSAASMIQIDSLNNTNDGDYFWQGNNFGQGGGGYKGLGTFTPGSWHRIALAVDLAATPPVVTKFADGIKQDDWQQQSLDQNRRALQEYAILFGDNGDEHRKWYVSSLQIREGKLSDAQLKWLGKPSASGIPLHVPTPTVNGQWDFEEGLEATVGEPLEFFGGENSPAAQNTEFMNTADLEIAGINGVDVNVMVVPYIRSNELGYIMRHGIAPNGGGTKVNQYTLIYDVYIDTRGDSAASMIQIDSLNNTNDGDYFWQGNNFGQGGGGYNGEGTFTPGAWHRVSLAVDLAATPPVVTKYADGIKQDDWIQQSLDQNRRALQEYAILFGDNGDEHRRWYVNSLQIREGKLSDEQLERLGGPSPEGLPLILP